MSSPDRIEQLSQVRRDEIEAARLMSEPAIAQEEIARNWRECFPEIIGRSPAMQRVLETVAKVARSDSSVLIYGESGTGKELIAAALHRLSPRSTKRFIPLNCSAIPESLLESELFGHEKGAFTGAVARRQGHFELADGGTLFLDEIGDMPMRLQAKLLRVLQEKQFTSVGGSLLKNSDVRIIAATNVDLAQAVQEGRFRLDLFYRLNVLPINLPPLRERREDILELLQHFLRTSNRIHGSNRQCYFSDEVLELLCQNAWRGNVRELQNLVERLVVTSSLGGEIRPEHLPPEFLIATSAKTSVTPLDRSQANPQLLTDQHEYYSPTNLVPSGSRSAPLSLQRAPITFPDSFGSLPESGIDLAHFVNDLENHFIEQALARTSNNKNQAAKLLGLNRTTLVERLKKRRISKT